MGEVYDATTQAEPATIAPPVLPYRFRNCVPTYTTIPPTLTSPMLTSLECTDGRTERSILYDDILTRYADKPQVCLKRYPAKSAY